MRIIITGGTGLIGRALARDLGNDEHEVIVLSRNPQAAGALPPNTRAVQWDGRSAEGWGELVDGVDAIVNLAGASIAGGGRLPSRWTAARKRLILDSRINAGRAVVAAVEAAQTKPNVLIQSSAVGYYGPREDSEITEEARAGSDFLAVGAVEWEQSTAAVEAQGVRRAIVRTGVVLSTKGGALPSMMLPFSLYVGGPLGSGKQWFPWIHIDDVVAALRFLIEDESASGPYNVSSPNPLRNRDFSYALGVAMRRPSFMLVPGFVLRLLFGEVAATLLEGQRVIPARLAEAGFEFDYPEAEAALADLITYRK